MYGWTPDKVATIAGAYLEGLQSGGHVIGTIKHFPGLGDVGATRTNPSRRSLAAWPTSTTIDWAPYKTLMATGRSGMIMTTHVTVDAVDRSQHPDDDRTR